MSTSPANAATNPLASNRRSKSVPRSISSESVVSSSPSVTPPGTPKRPSFDKGNGGAPSSGTGVSERRTSGHQTTLLNTPIDVKKPRYAVEAGEEIYKNDKILFSALHSHSFGVGLVWSDWTTRIIKMYENGFLSYDHPVKEIPPHNHFYTIKADIEVKLMGEVDIDNEENKGERLQGMVIKCKSHDNLETYIRCILASHDVENFIETLVKLTGNESLRELAIESLQRDTMVSANTVTGAVSSSMKKTKASATHLIHKIGIRKKSVNSDTSSVMRKAIARAMDSYDKRSKEQRIRAKRGDFKWLPVLGDNDLIHGSWWFVLGSIGVVLTACGVTINKYYFFLDDDDSTLSKEGFVASWILMAISGLFSTLGSLAFVRAFHEDPPMRPLFKWYHLQSDELVASWLFFLATVPFVPYILIFLAEAEDHDHALFFLVALGFAVVVCLGSLLFVRACYPTDKQHRDIIPRVAPYICCFASQKWIDHHLMNDWIGGSWFFFWATEFATFACGILFIYACFELSSLQVFIYGTSLAENLAFLLGSAYFISGSFPEEHGQGSGKSGDGVMSDDSQKGESSNKDGVEVFVELSDMTNDEEGAVMNRAPFSNSPISKAQDQV